MSSVTFSTGVGGDGSTVTDDNNATTGLREGGWKTRFVPCFTQQVAVANYVVTKADEASTSASAASSSATAAAASYDSFDDRYLGAKSSEPSVDNDGNTLLTGAIYWNSSTSVMKVWSGTAWVSYNPAISYLPLSGGTMTGAITFNAGQTITGYLPTAGGTMTGAITFAAGQSFTGTATTATNIAGGSNGTIPYQSASGTTQMLAVGSPGKVLQTNGSGAPTWETPSSGAMTLISTTTASSASSVTFTGLTAYNNYRIIISGLTFSDLNALEFRFGQPSITTSGYEFSSIYLDSVAIQKWYNAAESKFYLISSNVSINASRGVGGTVDVFDMTSGKYPRIISNMGYYFASTPAWTFNQTWGISTNVSGFPTTVIEIKPSSNTFSGTISIYGITA